MNIGIGFVHLTFVNAATEMLCTVVSHGMAPSTGALGRVVLHPARGMQKKIDAHSAMRAERRQIEKKLNAQTRPQ